MRDSHPIFQEGQIVKISIKGLSYTSEGFATVSHDAARKRMRVYQFIDLVTYPSCKDFHGETSTVEEGQLAVVMGYVGRPNQVKRDPVWFKYDVYDVLINGNVRQMFRQNLIPVLTGSSA